MEQKIEQKKYFSRLGLAYFAGSVLIYAVQYLVAMAVRLIRPQWLEDTDISLLLSMLGMYLIGMPLMALLISRIPAREKRNEKKISAGEFFCVFCIGYALLYLSNLVGTMITDLIGNIKGNPVPNEMFELVMGGNTLLLFALSAVCAPVWEELLFRKLLVDRTARYGEGVSILLSGLIFGLFHGNLSQFVYAFAFGLFLAYIYIRTGRIRYTILLHMLINAISVLASGLLKAGGFAELVTSPGDFADFSSVYQLLQEHSLGLVIIGVYSAAVLGIALTGIILLVANLKKFVLTDGGEPLEGGVIPVVVCNPGMLLFIVFWAVMILLQLME